MTNDGEGTVADLRTFLGDVRSTAPDDIVTVDRELSPNLEISTLAKLCEAKTEAMLYVPNVSGSSLGILTGVFGSKRTFARALGCDVATTRERYLDALDNRLPVDRRESGPVQEDVQVGSEVDLGQLPIPTHSPLDSGAYITAGVGIVTDPVSGATNTGIYRMMVIDESHVSVWAAPSHNLGRLVRELHGSGRKLDIAIVIGHHPAFLLGSQASLSATEDAYELVGGLMGESLPVLRAVTSDLFVPADAEIVLEGTIDPDEIVTDGPFGEFTYYYASKGALKCKVNAITRRSDAIYHDIQSSHREHRLLFSYPSQEAHLLRALRAVSSDVLDVAIPVSGACFHAYVRMSKRSEGDPRRLATLALATSLMLKLVIVVDEDVDIREDAQVMEALATRFQADRDLFMIPLSRGYQSDPSAYDILDRTREGFGTTKVGIDATAPMNGSYGPRSDAISPEHADSMAEYMKEILGESSAALSD